MVNERRQYPRCEVSIDGRWLGESGGTTCQVANISLGGCFVRTSAPSVEGLGVLRLIFGHTPHSRSRAASSTPRAAAGSV